MFAKCVCDCGRVKDICLQSLTSGVSKGCGCERPWRRGRNPLVGIYGNMVNRCYNVKSINYERYGGRGIRVCPEWRESRKEFYRWAKPLYSKGLQLNRIDNNGNYTPGNCNFVEPKHNVRNRSNTVFLRVNGVRMSLGEAVELYGKVPYYIAYNRHKNGYSWKESILTPVGQLLKKYG